MLATPYVASLRIYEPLEAFEESDQLRWGQLSTDLHTGREEQLSAIKRLIHATPPAIGVDGAHIIDHNDPSYVGPWGTAQRGWAALSEFK